MASKIEDLITKLYALARRETLRGNNLLVDMYCIPHINNNKLLLLIRYNENIERELQIAQQYLPKIKVIIEKLDIQSDTQIELVSESNEKYIAAMQNYSEYRIKSSLSIVGDELHVSNSMEFYGFN